MILTGNSSLYGSDPVVLITKQTALIRLTQHRFILIQLVRDLFCNKQWSDSHKDCYYQSRLFRQLVQESNKAYL